MARIIGRAGIVNAEGKVSCRIISTKGAHTWKPMPTC